MRKVNIASDLATVATCFGFVPDVPVPVHRVIRSFSRRVASAFSFDFCCLPVVLLVLLKVQTCHRRWGFKFKHRVASRRLRSESTATVPRFPYPFVHRYPSMRSAQVQLSEVFAPSTMLGLFCVFVCLWEPSNWTAESPLLTHSHSYRLCLFNFRLRTKWAWADGRGQSHVCCPQLHAPDHVCSDV